MEEDKPSLTLDQMLVLIDLTEAIHSEPGENLEHYSYVEQQDAFAGIGPESPLLPITTIKKTAATGCLEELATHLYHLASPPKDLKFTIVDHDVLRVVAWGQLLGFATEQHRNTSATVVA